MTFNDVQTEINKQYERAHKEWEDYTQTAYITHSRKPYTGFKVNYKAIDNMLVQAAQDEFGFTLKQANFIFAEAYGQFHSSYEDMPQGMRDLCQFVICFNKLK